jgi:hypothetical protein
MPITETLAPSAITSSQSSAGHARRDGHEVSVPFVFIVCLVAVVVCAYSLLSFANAETVSITHRLSIGLAFALSLSSGAAVSHMVESRHDERH